MMGLLEIFLFIAAFQTAVFARSVINPEINDRPIIAILAQVTPFYNNESYIVLQHRTSNI